MPGKPSLYHKHTLQWIQRLSRTVNGKLDKSKSPISALSAKLSQTGNRHEISFPAGFFGEKAQRLDIAQTYKNVRFVSRNLDLVVEDLYLCSHNGAMITCDIRFFYTHGFSFKKKYFHRVVIPLTREIYFRFQLEQKGYRSDLGYNSAVGTSATIDGDQLSVQIIHDEKKDYFIAIHSLLPQTHEVFAEKIFALTVSLGYIMGHMPGDKAYYFSYENRQMRKPVHVYVKGMREAIISSYTPIHTNPFAWKGTKRSLAEKLYRQHALQPISIDVFSGLCQKAHNNIDFSSVLLLIIESSVATLLFMPGGYAIALESLVEILLGKSSDALTPVTDKSLAKKIRLALTETLQTFSDNLEEEARKVLQGKIDQINQVTNKSRLRLPFEKLGIALTESDLRLINSRNDFLHGRIPDVTSSGEERTTSRKNRDLFYSAMHFYTLLNMLILKWSGFDGYVLNHPQIHAYFTKIKMSELPYRKI